MIKIHYAYGFNKIREYWLIKQGLENNPRVEIVDSEQESDFVFQLAYHHKKNRYPERETFPPDKTVVIDYHDNPRWLFTADQSPFGIKCLAYFKRSWVDMVDKGSYTTRRPHQWPPNFHPLTFAIMDEFIIKEELERDVILSCTVRATLRQRNVNRVNVLNLLGRMDIQGNAQIGRYNKGAMKGFNDKNMKDYWRLMKRSRIVVTCNPGKWEGDHRTWEAFASGALVFVDKMYTPLSHPLIDGEHCIFYETSDHGLQELRKRILYFLQETDHADEIAKRGFEFTMQHHRASNRIDEILEVIT